MSSLLPGCIVTYELFEWTLELHIVSQMNSILRNHLLLENCLFVGKDVVTIPFAQAAYHYHCT